MKTRARYGSGPRNLAVFVLFGHVGGAVAVGLLGALAAPYFALVGALSGAAAGWLGLLLGAIVLAASRTTTVAEVADTASDGWSESGDPIPAIRPWLAIATGASASTVVASVTLVAQNQGGFLDGSPCQEHSGGLGVHSGTIDTLIPAQYTCLYTGGVLPLVPPLVLALLSIVALLGAAAIGWGLWALRPRDTDEGPECRIDTVLVVLATAVGIFLAIDGVLGAVALLAPAGIGS